MDNVSKKTRSKVMRAIKSANTQPEVLLRKRIWKAKLRFRLHYGSEKIDIAFPSRKIAVFVDGCFWHSCPLHSHVPKSNKAYWAPKLKKNIARDKRKEMRLKADGWRVIRVWEHEVQKSLERCLRKISRANVD